MAVASRPIVDPGSGARTALGLAVFDLDRTLIPGSCLGVLGRELVDAGLVRRAEVLRFALVESTFRRGTTSAATLERVCRALLQLAADRNYAPLHDAAKRIAPCIVDRTYRGAHLLLDQHRRAGDVTVLLSAAPHDLVAEVGRLLRFDVCIGTEIEVDGDRITGRLGSVFCYGPGKLVRLRETFGDDAISAAAAYADSASDLVLLRQVGRPVAVNPDRALAAAADDAQWPIVRFG